MKVTEASPIKVISSSGPAFSFANWPWLFLLDFQFLVLFLFFLFGLKTKTKEHGNGNLGKKDNLDLASDWFSI